MIEVKYINTSDDTGNQTISIAKCTDSRLPDSTYLYMLNTQWQFDKIRDEIIAGQSLSDAYKKYRITKIYPCSSMVAPLKWHVFNFKEFDPISRTYKYPDFGTGWIYDQIQIIFDEWYDGLTTTGVAGRLGIAPGVIVPKYSEQICISTAIFRDFKSVTEAFISCGCQDILPNDNILECLQKNLTETSAAFYNIYKACLLQEQITTSTEPEPEETIINDTETPEDKEKDDFLSKYGLYIGLGILFLLLYKK